VGAEGRGGLRGLPRVISGKAATACSARCRFDTALILLAAGTGLRQGECFGLTLPRLDMLRRTVRVEEQLLLRPGGPPVLAPPKTDASLRTVPLPQVVVDAVAVHLAQFPVGESGLLFTNEQGLGIRRTRFSASVWHPSVNAAGLPVGTHFHELRHFYASLLIDAGESVKVVQSRLGHATAKETLDTYGHLWPDTENRTREAVDGVFMSKLDLTSTEVADEAIADISRT
jgi:integrase